MSGIPRSVTGSAPVPKVASVAETMGTQTKAASDAPASASAPTPTPAPADKIRPREFASLVARALSVSYRARGRASAVVSVLGFGLALLPMLISLALRAFTDEVQALFEGRTTFEAALALFALMAVLYVAQLLYTCVRSYFTEADTERVMRYIKESILRTTCTVRMRYIDNSDDFAEKIAFADAHAGEQVARSMQAVATWLQNLVTFVALAVVLAGINPWIVVVIVVTCAPSIFITYRQEREKYQQYRAWSRDTAFIQMYYQDCTRFQCLQELKFQRVFDYIKERKWRPSVDAFVAVDNALKRRHTVENCLADLFSGSVYLMILCIVAYEIYLNPAVGLGAFTLVVSVAGQMQSLTSQLFFGATQFAANARYMKDFFDLENLEYEDAGEGKRAQASASGTHAEAGAEAKTGSQSRVEAEAEGEARANMEPAAQAHASACAASSAPANTSRPRADIVFHDVAFSYPNCTAQALRGVSVTICEGERVAIVGRNGSGKSTFVNLLCGLYEPTRGSVTVGGIDAGAHPHEVRRLLSAVFQDFGRYEDSIRFNITISDTARVATDAQIMDLAEKADAAGFIGARSQGLDDVVGSYAEGGNNLSGGQWQRIAITRAAYRADARIMLLDEPTSALDPLAEAHLYRNFADLVEDRTAILISHRLGIASIVDRVLVFDGGRIVEDGTHDELMAKDGLYAELYRSQAQWYQDGSAVRSAE